MALRASGHVHTYQAHNGVQPCVPCPHTIFAIPQILDNILAYIYVCVCVPDLTGKVLYMEGYCTGNPNKRMRGALSYLGLLPLLGSALWLGAKAVMGQ